MAREIFVSYASQDKQARHDLERVANSLRLVLVDLAHQGWAHDWKAQYLSELEGVSGVVVLVGEGTHLSEPVKWEIAEARRSGKPVLGLQLPGTCPQLPQGLLAAGVEKFGTEEARRRLRVLGGNEAHGYLSELAHAIRAELSTGDLPDGPVDELLVSYAVLLLAKGERVIGEDVHNAWSAWMMRFDPAHPAIAPYRDLDVEIAAQDEPYVEAIHRVAKRMRSADGDE